MFKLQINIFKSNSQNLINKQNLNNKHNLPDILTISIQRTK